MIVQLSQHWRLSLSVLLIVSFTQMVYGAPLPVSAPEEVGLSSERLQRIDAIIKHGVGDQRIPGAVVAIARRGKLAYFRAFGMQNTVTQTPMRTDTIFRIYSMTKPIVSVGAMTFHEEAKFYFSEPVAKYLPVLKNMTVAVEKIIDDGGNSEAKIVPARRLITIHDLFRHTSGFTYGFFGSSPARRLLKESGIGDLNFLDVPLKEFVGRLAELPLAYQPGAHWEYGRSTDVLGHLLEVISNKDLGSLLQERLFGPLQMVDTGFQVPKGDWGRIAEPLENTAEPELINITRMPELLSGGHGLVSTAGDYLRFCQMLLNGGTLDGVQILGPKTIQYMTTNHLSEHVSRMGPYYLPGPGYGFGLGFGVREENGISGWPGSENEFFWGGYAGTYFWVDPVEEMVVVLMTQSVVNRNHYRMVLRNLVYQAIID